MKKNKGRKGKKNPAYKHGKYCKKYYCECGKKLSGHEHKRCYSCASKYKWKSNIMTSGMKNKKHTKKSKQKISRAIRKLWKQKEFREKAIHSCSLEARKKISIANKGKHGKNSKVRHHIYLRKNGEEILNLTNSKHAQLHNKVYEYLYKLKGKKGIDNYLKWFDKKYGLNYEKK